VFALTLLACSATDDDELDGPDDDDLAEVDELNGKADGEVWSAIGLGVAYQRVSAGDGVLIAYGGYSAKLTYSAGWATELVDAKLGGAGVGHIYAVKGPLHADYAGAEIGNSKLRAHLATLGSSAPIYVVGHSSGSFVAHELVNQLHARGDTATLGRIAYADLDGGGGLSQTVAHELGHLAFVYAKDPTLAHGYSQNAGTAMALGMTYSNAKTFEVTVPGTGCNSGAGWCMHDVVITHRPHNSTAYDLADDYTDFEHRPVTTEYLSLFLPE
jgi:hypothetical protein